MARTVMLDDLKSMLSLALAMADEMQLHDVGIALDMALVAAARHETVGTSSSQGPAYHERGE